MSNVERSKLEIIEEIGIIGRDEKGYTKKLVLAKWYDKPPVYEIRVFDPKGIAKKRPGMTPEEFRNLKKLIGKL